MRIRPFSHIRHEMTTAAHTRSQIALWLEKYIIQDSADVGGPLLPTARTLADRSLPEDREGSGQEGGHHSGVDSSHQEAAESTIQDPTVGLPGTSPAAIASEPKRQARPLLAFGPTGNQVRKEAHRRTP